MLTAHPEVVITWISAIIPSAFWIRFNAELGPGVEWVPFIESLQTDDTPSTVTFMNEQLRSLFSVTVRFPCIYINYHRDSCPEYCQVQTNITPRW